MTTEASQEECSHIEDGKLVGVTETHNIFKTADGAETRNDDGTAETLDTKSLVSMNMWGLTPEVYGDP